jgi:hypothetical protein
VKGLRLKKLSSRDRDRVLTGLNFDDLPTRHSCLLMYHRNRTEQALRDALADAGGSIEWGCEVGVDHAVARRRAGRNAVAKRTAAWCSRST